MRRKVDFSAVFVVAGRHQRDVTELLVRPELEVGHRLPEGPAVQDVVQALNQGNYFRIWRAFFKYPRFFYS